MTFWYICYNLRSSRYARHPSVRSVLRYEERIRVSLLFPENRDVFKSIRLMDDNFRPKQTVLFGYLPEFSYSDIKRVNDTDHRYKLRPVACTQTQYAVQLCEERTEMHLKLLFYPSLIN